MAGDATGALLRPMPRVFAAPVSGRARSIGDAVQKMTGNDLCVDAIGSAEQVQANGLDDRPKEKLLEKMESLQKENDFLRSLLLRFKRRTTC